MEQRQAMPVEPCQAANPQGCEGGMWQYLCVVLSFSLHGFFLPSQGNKNGTNTEAEDPASATAKFTF